MSTQVNLSRAFTLHARRRLAAWVSEHGAQDGATCELLDVLADLDKALDMAGIPLSDQSAVGEALFGQIRFQTTRNVNEARA